jgi:transcriptional regulator of acetoin/glycerol metabolism
VAQLGFAAVGDHLADRVVEEAWLLAEVAAELGAHRLTVHRLLERHGIQLTL